MGRRVPESLQLPPATSTKPSTEIDEQKKLGFGPEEVDLGHGNPRLHPQGIDRVSGRVSASRGSLAAPEPKLNSTQGAEKDGASIGMKLVLGTTPSL